MNYQKPDPMLNLTKQAIEAGVEGAARVGAIPPVGAQARPDANMLDQLQEAWQRYGKNLSIGGGIGALLGGSTSAMVGGSRGETPAERRRRILRDALVGGAFGAGAGVALPAAADAFSTAAPAASKAEQSAQAFANQFSPDKPLGSGWASVGMGTSGLVGSSWLRGNSALGKMDTAVRGAADTFTKEWNSARAEASRLAAEAMNKVAPGQSGTTSTGLAQMPGGVRLTGPQRMLSISNAALLGHMRPMINQFQSAWGDMSLVQPNSPFSGKVTANEVLANNKWNIPLDARQLHIMEAIDNQLNQDSKGMLDRMSARKPGMLNATKRILFPSSGQTHVYNGPNRASEFKAPMGWGGRAAGALGFAFPLLAHYVTPMAPKIPEIVKATLDGVSPE